MKNVLIDMDNFDSEKIENITRLSRTNVRARKGTLLKLQWLADRVRKIELIKKQLAEGTYHVDSREVSRAILSLDIKKSGKEDIDI